MTHTFTSSAEAATALRTRITPDERIVITEANKDASTVRVELSSAPSPSFELRDNAKFVLVTDVSADTRKFSVIAKGAADVRVEAYVASADGVTDVAGTVKAVVGVGSIVARGEADVVASDYVSVIEASGTAKLRQRVNSSIAKKTTLSGNTKSVITNTHVEHATHISGGAKLRIFGRGIVYASDSSTVDAFDSVVVYAEDNATVVTHASTVTVFRRSRAATTSGPGQVVDRIVDFSDTDWMTAGRKVDKWLEHYGLPIENGKVRVIKALDMDLRAAHTAPGSHERFQYALGTEAYAPDWAANSSCGQGLHFSAYQEQAAAYVSSRNGADIRYLVCEVDVNTAVVLGDDKIKAPRATPLFEIDAWGDVIEQAKAESDPLAVAVQAEGWVNVTGQRVSVGDKVKVKAANRGYDGWVEGVVQSLDYDNGYQPQVKLTLTTLAGRYDIGRGFWVNATDETHVWRKSDASVATASWKPKNPDNLSTEDAKAAPIGTIVNYGGTGNGDWDKPRYLRKVADNSWSGMGHDTVESANASDQGGTRDTTIGSLAGVKFVSVPGATTRKLVSRPVSELNVGDTIEVDTRGYGYNGTMTGTFVRNSSSADSVGIKVDKKYDAWNVGDTYWLGETGVYRRLEEVVIDGTTQYKVSDPNKLTVSDIDSLEPKSLIVDRDGDTYVKSVGGGWYGLGRNVSPDSPDADRYSQLTTPNAPDGHWVIEGYSPVKLKHQGPAIAGATPVAKGPVEEPFTKNEELDEDEMYDAPLLSMVKDRDGDLWIKVKEDGWNIPDGVNSAFKRGDDITEKLRQFVAELPSRSYISTDTTEHVHSSYSTIKWVGLAQQ
jgi:hypothetical protein